MTKHTTVTVSFSVTVTTAAGLHGEPPGLPGLLGLLGLLGLPLPGAVGKGWMVIVVVVVEVVDKVVVESETGSTPASGG